MIPPPDSTAPTPLRSRALLVAGGMLLLAIVYLRGKGRIWWCECRGWSPIALKVNSPHNSQHVFDAYSLSHMLHGILFFGLLYPFRRKLSLNTRAAIAAGIEIGWEVLEN